VIVAWVALAGAVFALFFLLAWTKSVGQFQTEVAGILSDMVDAIRKQGEALQSYEEAFTIRAYSTDNRIRDLYALAGQQELWRGEVLDRLSQPEDEEYSPLDEEQKRELRVTWGTVACSWCGFLHPGLCPRVKEMRYLPNGNQERVMLWPDGQWAVPKGAHSYREVFGTPVPQTQEEAK
jgi:hypothetical protein